MENKPTFKSAVIAMSLTFALPMISHATPIDPDDQGGFEFYSENSISAVLLTEMESLAEDAYDFALNSEVQKFRHAAVKVNVDWKSFRAQAKSAGASQALLSSMDKSVRMMFSAGKPPLNKINAARAANRVSANMEGLFSLFSPKTPAIIMTLDYYGRELVLDGFQNDFTMAQSQLGKMIESWNSLKPAVIKLAGGPEAANEFDASLEAMHRAIVDHNSDSLVQQAKANLELTDKIEGLYK